MSGGAHTSLIRKARLAGGRDALAAGSRLARLLAAEDLAPAGLPANALLLVRRLRAPAPACATHDIRPPTPWVRTLGADLDRLRAAAACPANGPVPAGAEAVVFRDHAELLACLARDWVAGDAAQRWWWKALLPGGLDAADVARLWLEHVPFVPAALHALHAQGSAARFLARLDQETVQALTEAVISRFGLAELRPAFAEAGDAPGTPLPPASGRARRRIANPPSAPWRTLVPASEAVAPDAPREILLGLCVTLQETPAKARSTGFAAALTQWLRHDKPAAPGPADAGPATPPPRSIPRARGPSATANSRPSATAPAHQAVWGDSSTAASPPAARAQTGTPLEIRAAALRPAAAPRPPQAPRDAPPIPAGTHAAAQAPQVSGAARSREVPAAAAPLPYVAREAGETLHTGFAGIFFLANVALRLDLYGDFSRPLHRRLELPFWDFLALAGEALAGPALRNDPVWALLARLSGRPAHRAPGRGWQPPDEWRIPPEWLAGFAPATPCRWQARHGRLRVMHAAGFPILDLPLRGRSAARLLATEWQCGLPLAAEPHRCAEPRTGSAGPARLRRWLGWLTPCLRARLGLALGLPGGEDPGRFLCRRAGKVVTGTAALDVHLSLDAHPIEIRVAGLDRDPGWVPAAGRSLRFHFD